MAKTLRDYHDDAGDECARGVVGGGMCVGVNEAQFPDKLVETDNFLFVKPKAQLLCDPLRVDDLDYRAERVDVETEVFTLEMRGIVTDRVAEDDDGVLVALESGKSLYGPVEEGAQVLASLFEGDETLLSESVACRAVGVGVRGVQVCFLNTKLALFLCSLETHVTYLSKTQEIVFGLLENVVAKFTLCTCCCEVYYFRAFESRDANLGHLAAVEGVVLAIERDQNGVCGELSCDRLVWAIVGLWYGHAAVDTDGM